MVAVWTDLASQDLKNIFSYISKSSPYYAHLVRKQFLRKSKELTRFPDIGRTPPENGLSEYREIFVYSYRLIYRITQENIYIVAIVHMRQKLQLNHD